VAITPELWQTVKTLFHAVLERPPAERTAFLEQNCSDPDIRHEVATLLAGYKEAGAFLSDGRLDAAAKPEVGRLRPGEILAGRFNILRFIAAGGMGEVYAAEDVELREHVAIKIISPEIVQAPSALARFKREVQLARRVTHPNVCRLYDLFRHQRSDRSDNESQLIFVSMELLEGETLSARLHRQQCMTIEEALPIVTQMAAGLTAAHQANIVHRDFKPSNVMLIRSGLAGGTRAVITDFGLAVRETSSDSQSTLISQQALAGTPAYMAPEVIKGEAATAACDIYALGLVIYEMITGHPAFWAETPMACAIKRLSERPVSPRQLVPELPISWERAIVRCLEREPAARFPTASDVARAIAGELPTMRNQRVNRLKVAALIILITVILAGVIVGRWYRTSSIKRSLNETDTIVLADFANSTGDVVFDNTLKQGLSVALSQSPFLNILPYQRMSDTLQLMGRPREQRLTEEVAREICVRTNSKVMVAGSIASLGSEYVVGLRAADCNSGNTVAQAQVQVGRKEEVLNALDKTANSLRAKLGESLASVQKYDLPLEEATTPSLEALKAYSRDDILSLKRAIEIDPNFAMAYASLAGWYSSLGENGLATANLTKAYQLRGRASEREKYNISAGYYGVATGELGKAIQVCEQWSRNYPRDTLPHVISAGLSMQLGQYEKVLAETIESIRLDPDHRPYGDLVGAYAFLNRFNEAKASYDQALARNIDDRGLRAFRYYIAFLEGDTAEMQRDVTWAKGKQRAEDELLTMESDTEAYAGRLRKAWELSRQAADTAIRNGQKETAALYLLNAALRDAEVGKASESRRQAISALALSPSRDYQILSAVTLARSGDSTRAGIIAADLHKRYPLNTMLNDYWLPTILATIEIKHKRAAKALELLQRASAYELGQPWVEAPVTMNLYPSYVRGEAYLEEGQGAQAAAEFQKLIEHRGVVMNSILGALTHLQMGRANVLSGNKESARKAYRDFLTLWKDADPDIPILKQARAEYAKLQ
jgi:serine/threonine protein kinase/tetratricopeptide (TPR) repeat protein